MINELNFEKLNLESIYEEFIGDLQRKEFVCEDPLEFLKNFPEKFLKSLKNKNLLLEKFDKDTHIKFFYTVCNKLKEIKRETKLVGLEIMSYLIDYIPEPYFMNAYVFEKELIQKVHQQNFNPRKKFVSVGDYELAKFDNNMGINFGFFASVLEEEKKEIKINTLRIISVIGSKENNKEFAIKSFKYIIELVNDEEDEVRHETVKSLQELIMNFKSVEIESLEIIFFNLREKSTKLRALIYSLISKIHCQLEKDFKIIIDNILNNLRLFKEDKLLVYQAIKKFSKNNCDFINIEYINAILDIDPNFLITEYNWTDMIYNATLIILQEFVKSNCFRIRLTLPKFFLKHYNFLSDKYSNIFEKEFYKNLYNIYYYHENLETPVNNLKEKAQYESENYSFDFEKDLEKISNFIQLDVDKTNDEAYRYIISFLKIILEGEQRLRISKVITITEKIINILEMLNFKIIVENNNSSDSNMNLVDFNRLLCTYLIFKIMYVTRTNDDGEKFLENGKENITRLKEFLKLKESKLFGRFIEHIEFEVDEKNMIEKAFLSEISNPKETCNSILTELHINFKQLLKESLIDIVITNPKKNLNYVHTKDKMNYPFYLKLGIKIKSSKSTHLIENSAYLIKNLNINLIKLNHVRKIDFDASCIKFLKEEKTLTIKTKVPIYLSNFEDCDHTISLSIKSSIKKDFVDLLNKLKINSIAEEEIEMNRQINFIITY